MHTGVLTAYHEGLTLGPRRRRAGKPGEPPVRVVLRPILNAWNYTERIWLTAWARSMTSWMDRHRCTRLYR